MQCSLLIRVSAVVVGIIVCSCCCCCGIVSFAFFIRKSIRLELLRELNAVAIDNVFVAGHEAGFEDVRVATITCCVGGEVRFETIGSAVIMMVMVRVLIAVMAMVMMMMVVVAMAQMTYCGEWNALQ